MRFSIGFIASLIQGGRNVYAAIAGCGARRHEGLLCEYRDPARRRINILDGKTGARVTYPYPINWLQLWGAGKEGFPDCKAPNFSELGSRVTVNWRRTGIPFTPLGARHACAIRLMGKVSVVAAAKSLGHSPAVHLATYQRWYSEKELESEWKKLEEGDYNKTDLAIDEEWGLLG